MIDATIPPPSDADREIPLDELYLTPPVNGDWIHRTLVKAVICRCHAAETALAAKDAHIAELEAERASGLNTDGSGCDHGFVAKTPADWNQVEATIAELREALRPFAAIGIPDSWPAECVLTWLDERVRGGVRHAYISYLSSDVDAVGVPKIADYRRAAAHLAKTAPEAD